LEASLRTRTKTKAVEKPTPPMKAKVAPLVQPAQGANDDEAGIASALASSRSGAPSRSWKRSRAIVTASALRT
jgi:hypothetical protein